MKNQFDAIIFEIENLHLTIFIKSTNFKIEIYLFSKNNKKRQN